MGARMASIRALVVPLVVWAVLLLLVLEASVNELNEGSYKPSLSLRDYEEIWEEGEEEVNESRTSIAHSSTTSSDSDSDSVTAVVVRTAARRLYSSSRLMMRRMGGKMRLRVRRVLKEMKPYTAEARGQLHGSTRIRRGNIKSFSKKTRSLSLSNCGNGCSPPPEPEVDPRFGVQKRLVPTGPNPLHN